MASKVKVEKFDRVNKSQLRLKGNHTRTGATTTTKTRAHGRNHTKRRH